MAEKLGKLGQDSGPNFTNLPSAFQYSTSLNCLISLSKGSGIEVLDVHSRKITARVSLADDLGMVVIFYNFLPLSTG